jgi:hypothetical protein
MGMIVGPIEIVGAKDCEALAALVDRKNDRLLVGPGVDDGAVRRFAVVGDDVVEVHENSS